MKKIVSALAKKLPVSYKVPESSFKASPSFSERKQLLTLLPKSWNRKKIVDDMQCSDFFAKESILLRIEVGNYWEYIQNNLAKSSKILKLKPSSHSWKKIP